MKQLPENKHKIKNIKLKGLLVFSLFIFYILSFKLGLAFAQELQRTITVINPTITQKLDPGGYAEGTTKIINESNTPLTFKVSVQDYTVGDTNGTPQLLTPGTLNNKYSAGAWIAINPATFTLQPGATQIVNYYLQVPKNATAGGHYAALVYTPVVEKSPDATGGTVNTQIGSLFYITVNGDITESAKVTKFLANAFQEYGPVKILTQITNYGNLHIAPKGKVTVSGLFFNETQELVSRNIFPETPRDFENSFGGKLMLGRYKADLIGSYGVNNNLPLVASLYFWVFPWRIVLVLILLIVALTLGAVYIKRRKETPPTQPSEPEKTAE